MEIVHFVIMTLTLLFCLSVSNTEGKLRRTRSITTQSEVKQKMMAGHLDTSGNFLKKSGEMNAIKYGNGTYRINFDVDGVDWRSRDSPIVQVTVLNRHHFRPNPEFGQALASTDSTPQAVILTEANKKFVRYCVLDGSGVPVDGETHVLIVWV